ncbi:MAG: nickel/cobalt transporter [Candidatus Promineifilaceae bacterium]
MTHFSQSITNTFRRYRIIVILLLALLASELVSAHPLGNFSVNRYSRLTIEETTATVFYVVDMAEVPAFQNRPTIDTNQDQVLSSAEIDQYLATWLPELIENLELRFENRPIPLTYAAHQLTFPAGQSSLETQRLELTLTATLPQTQGNLSYRDNNFSDRLGWQEIVLEAGAQTALTGVTINPTDISQALTTYPEDRLERPLAETEASFTIQPSTVASVTSQPQTSTVPTADPTGDERFSALINAPELTPRIIFLALLTAFGLGAAHALTPGHGKTIVGAYLVGSRGTAKQALFLGAVTTVTHTAGVFVLGFLVLFASRYILPEELFPWLSVLSGAVIVLIGLSMALAQWHKWRGIEIDSNNAYSHAHFGGFQHSHQPTQYRNLFALGVSGGLIPCPSALIMLLSAIALQRVGFGLILIVLFSLGLAFTLTSLGLLFVTANRWLEHTHFQQNRLIASVPIASALFVTVAGFVITIQAVLQTGVIF